MLFLPVEFNTVKIDALVDSAAYINSISERDAEKIRRNASQCIINKVPPPVLFKVSLFPQDDKPVYTQNLPVSINLKEDLTIELTLMHRYGIITTLPFSKYASPIFAQPNPNGKLRLLVDLRKINVLIADDYINNNHPVSTLFSTLSGSRYDSLIAFLYEMMNFVLLFEILARGNFSQSGKTASGVSIWFGEIHNLC